MLVALSVFAIVLSLLLVVGLHEAGHVIVARLFAVKIKRISIGFGKPWLSWRGKHGWEWVWGRWPLGGYVQLLNSRIEPVSPNHYPYCFDKKPIWNRVLILASGALANFIVAWLAFLLIFLLGYQQISAVIATVTSPSIAAVADLQDGDRFISIGEYNTPSWREVGMQLIMSLGKTSVNVTVENKAGECHQTTLDLSQWRYKRPGGNDLLTGIGIQPDLSIQPHVVKGLPFLEACHQAFLQIIYLLIFFLVMLKQLFTHVIPFGMLLGPLGLFTEMVNSFFQGFVVFLNFIASFSLAVALINLFPVPGLDGGSIVYALLEKIRGKPISVAMEVLLYRLAAIFFCLILVQLLLNDLQRYWS